MAPAPAAAEFQIDIDPGGEAQAETGVCSVELVKSGKYCHQCRQRTENFMAICRNTSKKPCPLHYCCRCLMNRYRENADDMVALGEWHCPKCRGICNCSVCSRKSSGGGGGGGNEEIPEVFGRIVADYSLLSDEIPRFLIDLNCDLNVDVADGFEITGGSTEASTSLGIGTPCNELSSYTILLANQLHRSRIEVQNENCLGGSYFPPEIHVPMPLGIDADHVASIKMTSEDIGHALQFLEFCKTFGQVISLNDDDPEILLQDIFGTSHISNMEPSQRPAFVFQEKIISMIQEDREEEFLLPSIEMNGESDGEPSCKLRTLNFLCDEALNTSVMRNFINGYKRERETVCLSESKSSCPLTNADKSDFDVTEHSEIADPDKSPTKKFKPDALRSEPKYVNAAGQKFWNFDQSSSSDMDIYVQDFGEEPMAQDKWFKFNPQQKDLVEKYLSSLSGRTSKKRSNMFSSHG